MEYAITLTTAICVWVFYTQCWNRFTSALMRGSCMLSHTGYMWIIIYTLSAETASHLLMWVALVCYHTQACLQAPVSAVQSLINTDLAQSLIWYYRKYNLPFYSHSEQRVEGWPNTELLGQPQLQPIVSYPPMARPSFRSAISYCWMETQKGLKYAGTLYYIPTPDSAPNMECWLSNKKRLKGAILCQIGLNFCSWAPENSFWVNLSIKLTESLTHNFWVKLRQ